MTQRISDADLAAATTTLVLGASESIIFLAREYGGSEFGLPLRDIASLADRRLSLRCLLPIPGVHQSRDGRLSQGESRIQTGPREVKATVRTFRSAGWRVRLVPETGLNAFLVADASECIFHEFSDGPLWDDEREPHHYDSQFENHWKTSLGVSALTSLYDREATLENPDDASQLAIASGTAWSSLLAQLSQSPRLLHTMEPRKFEELVAELLLREGLDPHLTPQSRDGGRDILAFHNTPLGQYLYLVECKRHSPKRPVDVRVVRQLYGVLGHERATAGLIVTTSYFTKDALSFRESIKHQMGLKDYEALRRWIKERRVS